MHKTNSARRKGYGLVSLHFNLMEMNRTLNRKMPGLQDSFRSEWCLFLTAELDVPSQKWPPKDKANFIPMVSLHIVRFAVPECTGPVLELEEVGRSSRLCKT